MTVRPLPIQIEVQAGSKLRGHEWLVLGSPLVFVHDEGRDLDAWGEALQLAADAGFHVIAVDLRGHGLSDGEPDSTRLGADLAALVRHVNRVWGTCGLVLAGRTCRGALGLDAGAQAPAQVFVSPDMPEVDESVIRASVPAIRMVMAGSLDPVAKSESERVFGALPGQKVMASVGDAGRGEELVTGRVHLLEDIFAFFRMYLPPAFGHSQTNRVMTEEQVTGVDVADR
jgi:pimeloyl-ACP methyl ester carboxylesterase